MMSCLLAFEVFDDVAAYWFIVTLLAFVVLPRLFYWGFGYIYQTMNNKKNVTNTESFSTTTTTSSSSSASTNIAAVIHSKGANCQCDDCKRKREITQKYEKEKQRSEFWSFWNIVWWICFIIFVLMLTYVNQMHTQRLASFNPYEILEIDVGADIAVIKKAYRRLSLQYHPDKNKDNNIAAQKFILISKAYQTLTDPATKENYEKYGNPDGYKGTSVTIGLPSFLTNRENERVILLTYFFALVVLCIVVGLWWRRASQYNPTGVLQRTMEWYRYAVKEEMAVKPLIPVLSSAMEFAKLTLETGFTQQDAESLKKLSLLLKNELEMEQDFAKKVKNVYGPWGFKVTILMHAYLLRVPIPTHLETDLHFVLRKIHHLLEGMIVATLAPHYKQVDEQWRVQPAYLQPILNMIQLSQLITQCLWVHSSPLLQLPYFDEKMVGLALKKYKARDVEHLQKLKRKDRDMIMKHLNNEQKNHVEAVARLIPRIDLHHNFEVEGEDDQEIYAGDTISIQITLERKHITHPIINDYHQVDDNQDDHETETESNDNEDDQKHDSKNQKNKNVSKSKNDNNSNNSSSSSDKDHGDTIQPMAVKPLSKEEVAAKRAQQAKAEEEDDPMTLTWNSIKKRRAGDDRPSPVAHAPFFPFPKKEIWYVILYDSVDKQIAGWKVVNTYNDVEDIEMKIQLPEDSVVQRRYEIYAMCDAYLGCDRVAYATLNVKPPKNKKNNTSGDDDKNDKKDGDNKTNDDDDEEQAEPEPEAKWYYLYCSSFGEMILTLFLLALLCVFLFNFLYSRGWIHTFASWWNAYGQPLWHSYGAPLWQVTGAPLWNVIRSYIPKSIYDPDAPAYVPPQDYVDSDSYSREL